MPPSSSISSKAAPQNPPDEGHGEIIIRLAETDDDVIAIHRFLLIVAQPAMRCPVDAEKSFVEVIRVAKYEAALMAIKDGLLIGTMGIIKPTWWYGNGEFLTDRWHFVLPEHWHDEVNKKLMEAARGAAADAGLEFVHQGKLRVTKNGMGLMMPRVYIPESASVPDHIGSA